MPQSRSSRKWSRKSCQSASGGTGLKAESGDRVQACRLNRQRNLIDEKGEAAESAMKAGTYSPSAWVKPDRPIGGGDADVDVLPKNVNRLAR